MTAPEHMSITGLGVSQLSRPIRRKQMFWAAWADVPRLDSMPSHWHNATSQFGIGRRRNSIDGPSSPLTRRPGLRLVV